MTVAHGRKGLGAEEKCLPEFAFQRFCIHTAQVLYTNGGINAGKQKIHCQVTGEDNTKKSPEGKAQHKTEDAEPAQNMHATYVHIVSTVLIKDAAAAVIHF